MAFLRFTRCRFEPRILLDLEWRIEISLHVVQWLLLLLTWKIPRGLSLLLRAIWEHGLSVIPSLPFLRLVFRVLAQILALRDLRFDLLASLL